MTRGIRPLRLLAVVALGASVAVSCGSDEEALDLDLSPAASNGRLRATELGCQSCHSINGSGGAAPTWKGLWGSTVKLTDGSEVVVDEEYVIRSVREPNAQRREGVGGAMGPYDEKRLSDEDLADVIEFIKALG